MELRRYVNVLRRRFWIVIGLVLIGAIAGDLLTSQATVYSASATIYIGPSAYQFGTDTGIQTGADQQILATTLIPTYERMLGSQPVAADAARRAGYGLTAGQVLASSTISSTTSTTLITVEGRDSNPSIAQAIANSLANAFTDKVKALTPSTGQGAVPAAPAYVFEQAGLPTTPLPSKTSSNIAKGVIVGLFLGLGLVGLLEYLDVSLKGPSDVERRLQLEVLGVIPLQRSDA